MHHFPWLRNRTTEHRKAGKARNTKENRRSKEFNSVSKQLVEHRSSPNDNLERSFFELLLEIITPENIVFSGVFLIFMFLPVLSKAYNGRK